MKEVTGSFERMLLVCYEFPPVNAGGTMRAVRFANELVRQGLDVQVVCADWQTMEDAVIDHSMSGLVDQQVSIYRVPVDSPSPGFYGKLVRAGYTLHTDEISIRWKRPLEQKLQELLPALNPDFVMVTMPPFGLHSIVTTIRKLTSSPVIADLRDAWSQWIMTPYASFLHYKARLGAERQLIRNVDLVSVTSKVTADELKRLHPEGKSKISYIPNSFDAFTSNEFETIDNSKEKLNFLYLGSFYFNPSSQALFKKKWFSKKPYQWFQYSPKIEDWSYRSPKRLLEIFDELLKSRPELIEKVRITFAGKKPDWWESMIFSPSLRRTCRHVGFVCKEHVPDLIREADALLLTSSKVQGGRDYSVAGKTYEYLAARKPIVAVVSDSAQRDLLSCTGTALCLDPDTPGKSASKLAQLLNGDLQLEPNNSEIEQFLTERVTEKLVMRIPKKPQV